MAESPPDPAPPPAPPPATPPPASPPASESSAGGLSRRAEDRGPSPTVANTLKTRLKRRKGTENVIGAFLLAILVGGAIVWIENGRCPGALRGAVMTAAPISIPLAVVIAGLLVNQDKLATRQERLARGVRVAAWAGAAAIAMITGILLALNESGNRDVSTRRCLVAQRETVPARTAGVGEWVLVLRCSDQMSPVRVDVDRRTWWEYEAGGTVEATIAKGPYGFEWVVDTTIGPPIGGFTSW